MEASCLAGNLRGGQRVQYDGCISARGCLIGGQSDIIVDSELAFPRRSRLLLPTDYSVVFKQNVRVSDRYWTILAHKGQGGSPRLGMAIAKKRARRAVDRNRLKRVVREYFRHHSSKLGSVDLVVMNRDQATTATNEELRHSLDLLWSSLVIKCKK